MKNVNKIGFISVFSMLLMLCLTCIVFTACSADNNANTGGTGENQSLSDNTPENTQESTTESYYLTLGERDFNGGTFTVLDSCHHPDLQVNFPVEESRKAMA